MDRALDAAGLGESRICFFGADPGAWEAAMAERTLCYSMETGDGMGYTRNLGKA